MRRLPPLVLFGIAIGLFSIVSNWALAGTPLWLAGLGAGAVVALAWWLQAGRVGPALIAAAAVLFAAQLLAGEHTVATLALTSGACAGILLTLLTCAELRIKRK